MSLSVTREPIGEKMYRLRIFRNGRYIGEYERSKANHIDRKIKEVSAAEVVLVSVFEEHGEFCVRWDGTRKQKSIRVNGIEVAVVPKKQALPQILWADFYARTAFG